MAAVKLRSLPAHLAAKLDQLETRTAVLERDARNGRSITTLALNAPQARDRLRVSRAAVSAWPQVIGTAYRAVGNSLTWLDGVVHSPRLHSALRTVRECLLEGLFVLSLTCAALIAIVFAIRLLTPPE